MNLIKELEIMEEENLVVQRFIDFPESYVEFGREE